MKFMWIMVVLVMGGCGYTKSGTAPSLVVVPHAITYAINIPDPIKARTLEDTYPNGILESPLQAQHDFDYTATYLGSPNVYYGELAPPNCTYQGVGIVVAPHGVAGMETFTQLDWPGIGLEPGFYRWLGRFVYTAPADPSTYHPGKC